MTTTIGKKLQPVKTRQVNVSLTDHQDRVLKQYCVRHGHSMNTVVLAALCAMIEGFEVPENRAITDGVLNLKLTKVGTGSQ